MVGDVTAAELARRRDYDREYEQVEFAAGIVILCVVLHDFAVAIVVLCVELHESAVDFVGSEN